VFVQVLSITGSACLNTYWMTLIIHQLTRMIKRASQGLPQEDVVDGREIIENPGDTPTPDDETKRESMRSIDDGGSFPVDEEDYEIDEQTRLL
jgi:hypothetical protein